MQGLPDGTEEARLQEIEAQVEQHAAALKQVKAQNRQASAQQHARIALRMTQKACLACDRFVGRNLAMPRGTLYVLQAESAAAQMLERLEAAHAQYASQRSALAAQLDNLEGRLAEADAAAAAAQAARDAAVAGLGSGGLDEAAVRARMAAAKADSRVHEAALAAQEVRLRMLAALNP